MSARYTLGLAAFLLPTFLLPNLAAQQKESEDVVTIQAPEVPDQTPSPDLADVARRIREQTNAFRMKEKQPPVQSNSKLQETAQAFAKYMADTDRYGHTADDRRAAERASEKEYEYCIVLENIAYAFKSSGYDSSGLADQFVSGWKKSPGHRKNMLDPDVSETGVAIARSEKTGYYYAVQMFGSPRSAAIEFSIENRAAAGIDYSIGEHSYSLPPRYTRTHTVCRPPQVAFQWPDSKEAPAKLSPADGDHFLVTQGQGKWTVNRK